MTQIFEGVRVVELAQYVFVPAAGTLMADHGAEVIKIEPPGAGDPVADPLQRGECGEEDELRQGDVGQDLCPVCHRVMPSSAVPPGSWKRPAVP